jgi:ATP-binding cassette subfamily B protein
MAAITGKAVDIKLLSRVFAYVKPYKKRLLWAIVCTILLAVLAPLRPLLIERTIDKYIVLNDAQGLLDMTLLMIGLLLTQTGVQYYYTFITNALGQSVIHDLRMDIFTHITNLRLRYFDRTPIGQLITRTVSDLETIADIFSEGLISIVGDVLQIVTIITCMLIYSWQLTLVVLAPMPLLLLATYVFKEAIKTAFQEVRKQVSQLNTFLQEHITGMSIIQFFGRESQEFEKFKTINAKHRDAHISSNWSYSVFFPVVEIISALSMGLLVWYGAKLILGEAEVTNLLQFFKVEKAGPGLIVAFLLFINMLFRPIRELADKFNTLQMGMVGAERIFSVLDTKESTDNSGTYMPAVFIGKIEFKEVWFAYQDEDWVLKDISFRIEPGQTLALVGATGAGKSSIINLLNRFYEINKGSILVDGVDIRSYDLGYLRAKVATVLQDVFLFSDTIANNISLYHPNITKEQMLQAAAQVGAKAFIDKLPGGFDYEVMERGATLSTGQAQLLSFIRAMVYNPAILVLDEATSSVDTATETLIQDAVLKLMKGRTCVVIAHRLSTIQHADKIVVLDAGEIKESGTHQELLKLNGYYKTLYQLQFSDLKKG